MSLVITDKTLRKNDTTFYGHMIFTNKNKDSLGIPKHFSYYAMELVTKLED